ncbi:Mov34/MPN/PAD-1 family protein [Flagellimonas sediminis]|nr:Mov34/MPN/PAD-1 family protein [Allomuricauda sediminis]
MPSIISDMVFSVSNGKKLKIDEKPIKSMLSYVQDMDEKDEAGGVILGRVIKESNNVVIDVNTEPMEGDIRSRTRFKRGKKRHQKIINEIWKKSEGTCNYLGEWHTHPEKNPSPSSVDIKSWTRILKKDVFSTKYLYFIIVGTESIGVWEGNRENLKIKKLNNVKR